MNRRKRLSVAAMLGLTAGCAAPLAQIDYYSVETEALQRIRGMTVVDDASVAAGGYRSLGEVAGMFCERGQYRVLLDAEEEFRIAVEQIKLRAARIGADHITTPVCDERSGIDMTNNCMGTLVCRAEALAADGD